MLVKNKWSKTILIKNVRKNHVLFAIYNAFTNENFKTETTNIL